MAKFILALDFRDAEPSDDTLYNELERITGMVADGYVEGEINFDAVDGTEHHGWWRTSKEVLWRLPEPSSTD